MNKALLECPKCRKSGGLDILPWATGNNTFGALSVMCYKCDAMLILTLAQGREIQFGPPTIPTMPK